MVVHPADLPCLRCLHTWSKSCRYDSRPQYGLPHSRRSTARTRATTRTRIRQGGKYFDRHRMRYRSDLLLAPVDGLYCDARDNSAACVVSTLVHGYARASDIGCVCVKQAKSSTRSPLSLLMAVHVRSETPCNEHETRAGRRVVSLLLAIFRC